MIVRLASMLLVFASSSPTPCPVPESVQQAETERVEMIERVLPSVVCIFDKNLRGGGSGVLVDADGYGLTNYHVISALLDTRTGWGGLGDGVLYELQVLGIDITGDVAMFRLIPPKEPYRFPHAPLGDSDRVRVGDAAIAMGNPFMLSEDYSPSITLGLVTGIHRYQEGTKGNLTYTDCIQIDAAINPGNSGGPLFSADGEVIGINGRISINTRGRFNVGFGYAITANQIKRFMPSLRAGLLALHGTWQATVRERADGAIVFDAVQPSGAVDAAGLRSDDRVVALDGVPVTSINQVVSLMGTYPAGWPVSITNERDGKTRTTVVRLSPIKPKMRAPFKVDRDVSARQVKRALADFQRAVFGEAAGDRPSHWRWKVRREFAPDENGRTVPPKTLHVSVQRGGSLSVARHQEDGSERTLLEYDGETAVRFEHNNSKSYELDNEATMILATLYVIYQELLTPVEDIGLAGVRHVGGDALVEYRFGDDPYAAERKNEGPIHPPLLELIEWSVTDQAKAIFAFDVKSSRLVRARVLDSVSGVAAVIDFGDYRDIGGMQWPCSVSVSGAGYDYRDTLSDWEVGR